MLRSVTTSLSKYVIGRKLSNKGLFYLVVAILFGFSIQTFFRPLVEVPLSGATPIPSAISLNSDNWFEGEFQAWYELKMNRSFGFRPACVRLVNQLQYSLFDIINPQVVKGQDGYLFEAAYRNAVCGTDFIGNDSAAVLLKAMDAFRDNLLSKGKRLVILITPNKWRTLKSKVDWACNPKTTNYQILVGELKSRGYAVMDGIDLFEFDQRSDQSFPLHSKQGTHWSIYGAAASLSYLNYAFKQEGIRLPDFKFESLEVTDSPRNTDKDLHDLLNIMAKPSKEELAYPTLSFDETYKPRVLVVGDSYYWSYYYLKAHQGMFSQDSKFFYYNNSMYAESQDTKILLNDQIRKEELQACDAVLFVISEPALSQLGFGLTAFSDF